MKVCHVTTVHPYNDNRIFFKEVLSLKEAGHDVSLIAPVEEDFEFEGIQILSATPYKSRLKRFWKSSIGEVFKLCRKHKFDVCHFHDPELMPVAALLRLSGKKVIFDVHENNPAAIISKPYLKSNFVKKALAFTMDMAERFFFLFYNAIVTARPDISKRLKSYKPLTLRNFPILPKLDDVDTSDVDKTQKTMIYVGGITKIRGVKEIIEALDDVEGVQLWLLGPFEDELIKNECKALPGWSKVKYLGVVQPYEIYKYVLKADLGVITFLPVPNHLNTLATKPFEYMAAGLPILMSDFPYWRSFFADNSHYVDPEDPKAIGAKINALFADEEALKAMGKKNLSLSQVEYNWKSEFEGLKTLYQQLS